MICRPLRAIGRQLTTRGHLRAATRRPPRLRGQPPAKLVAPHELPPQAHQVAPDARHPWEVEELRLAVRPMEVVNRHLGDAETRLVDLRHHLDADHATILAQLHPDRKSTRLNSSHSQISYAVFC